MLIKFQFIFSYLPPFYVSTAHNANKALFIGLLLSAQTFANAHTDACAHKSHSDADSPITRRGVYLQATLGESIPATRDGIEYNTRSKPSVLFGGNIGYNFGNAWAVDLGVNHRYKYQRNGSFVTPKKRVVLGYTQALSTTSVMATGSYTFLTSTVSPYLAAGVGMASHNVGAIITTYPGQSGGPEIPTRQAGMKVNNFAWQVGTGIAFKVSNNISLDLGYRYIDLGAFKTTSGSVASNGIVLPDDPVKGRATDHEILLSIKYKL